jgi:hypothetical protein
VRETPVGEGREDAEQEEQRDQGEAPIPSRRDLARYRLPLCEAVDEEHASGHDRDQIEREHRVEQRLRRRARHARATRCGPGRRDRDDGDERQHDERQ